jgi:hypothetical protein
MTIDIEEIQKQFQRKREALKKSIQIDVSLIGKESLYAPLLDIPNCDPLSYSTSAASIRTGSLPSTVLRI